MGISPPGIGPRVWGAWYEAGNPPSFGGDLCQGGVPSWYSTIIYVFGVILFCVAAPSTSLCVASFPNPQL